MNIKPETKAGKRTCKYYKACGNAENCRNCSSFVKEKKPENIESYADSLYNKLMKGDFT